MAKLIINADGGSRGNPGPAAIGFVLRLPGGRVVETGEYLDKRTNNEAEYEGVIHPLQKANGVPGCFFFFRGGKVFFFFFFFGNIIWAGTRVSPPPRGGGGKSEHPPPFGG